VLVGDKKGVTSMADITYSFSDDQSEAVFSANTPRGEGWMKDSEITMPISEAKECIEAARYAGLVVAMFA
jgi:hypothetical protein